MSNPKEIARLEENFARVRLEENFARVMKAQQFVSPAFSVYGGTTGFQTYGVLGKQVFDNITQIWRRMFVHDLTDNFSGSSAVFEIDSPVVTPYPILKASGHVDRFTDPIVYDREGKLERVDHYLKNQIMNSGLDSDEVARLEARIEGGSIDVLTELMELHGENTRGFGKIQEVNLMLSTQTSYSDNMSYLRPETAQGAFTEFKSLFRYNKENLPFGIVNIGKAYRKEVSPVPFTRLREFYQAELEYFYDPLELKSATDLYSRVKTIKPIYSETPINVTTKDKPEQIQKMSIFDLLRNGIIQNELIFKFAVRAILFCLRIGIEPENLRLRQHMEDELAHYSSDCWDIEFDMSFSVDKDHHQWLEIIGISDRGTYDLSAHQKGSGQSMKVKRYLSEPKEVTNISIESNPKYWGKTYRSDSKAVLAACEERLRDNPDLYLHIIEHMGDESQYVIMLNEPVISKWKQDDNENFIEYFAIRVSPCDLKLVKVTQTQTYEKFIPNVVEPSFGLDRIMYSVLRSAFKIRDGDKSKETNPDRSYMALTSETSPNYYGIISLIIDDEHNMLVKAICDILDQSALASKSYKVDMTSVSVGKKYVRLDEIGTHIVFTIDNLTIKDMTFTVRYRDTMKQDRLHFSELSSFIAEQDRSPAYVNCLYRDLCSFD